MRQVSEIWPFNHRMPRYGLVLMMGVVSFAGVNESAMFAGADSSPERYANNIELGTLMKALQKEDITCPFDPAAIQKARFEDGRRICLDFKNVWKENLYPNQNELVIPLISEPGAERMPASMAESFKAESTESCRSVPNVLRPFVTATLEGTADFDAIVPFRIVFVNSRSSGFTRCDDPIPSTAQLLPIGPQ